MNELQIFSNEQFGQIRTIMIGNEPYFIGKDVALILGYKDTSDALKRHVDEEDKLTRCFADSGQNRDMYVINESGLYDLVFGSKLPNAKAFKRWVTHDVLPAIRKTGTYSIPDLTATSRPRYRARMINTAIKDVASTAKTLMKMFAVKEGIAQATAFNMIEKAYCIDLSPVKQLIQPADHQTGYLTPTEIGMKMGGERANKINLMLADLKLQCQELGAKGKKIWRLTDSGKNYGEEFPYDAKTGHSGYQIKWNENVLSLLKMEVGAAI